MDKKQIKLDEQGLRNFISYSVSRLLKEGVGRDLYYQGEYDGSEGSRYGADSMPVAFNPFDDDKMMESFEYVLNDEKYEGLTVDMFDEGGQFGDIWPVRVDVEFNVKEGDSGDYFNPPTPEEAEITGWKAGTDNLGPIKELVDKAIEVYFENYFDEEDIFEYLNDKGLMYEDIENRGITYHNDGNSSWKPKNPYEGMSWDEYRETKKKEREGKKEEDPERGMGEPKNHGITYHNPGPEADKDVFRPKPIHITRDDIKEMVDKAVGQLMEGFGLPGYDAWKLSAPKELDEPDEIDEDDFYDMIRSCDAKEQKEFIDYVKEYLNDEYEDGVSSTEEFLKQVSAGENPFYAAINLGVRWQDICQDFFDIKPVSHYAEDRIPDPREIAGID